MGIVAHLLFVKGVAASRRTGSTNSGVVEAAGFCLYFLLRSFGFF